MVYGNRLIKVWDFKPGGEEGKSIYLKKCTQQVNLTKKKEVNLTKTSQELRMLSPSLFIQGSQCKC